MYDPFLSLGGGGGGERRGQKWCIEGGNSERRLKWDGGVTNESLL